MRRRDLIKAIAASAVASPLGAVDAFRHGLNETGYRVPRQPASPVHFGGNDLLIQIKPLPPYATYNGIMDWTSISIAPPSDRDLELAVIDRDGPHTLVFPCRRILSGWAKVETKQRIDVRPTHWREWVDKP